MSVVECDRRSDSDCTQTKQPTRASQQPEQGGIPNWREAREKAINWISSFEDETAVKCPVYIMCPPLMPFEWRTLGLPASLPPIRSRVRVQVEEDEDDDEEEEAATAAAVAAAAIPLRK